MKRHVTPYFQMINYFRWKQEEGFAHVGAQLKMATKLKNKSMKHLNTVAAKLADINTATKEDFEVFWREQVEYWSNQFQWYREDGPTLTREELDKEIDAYMANRGFVPTDERDELDKELEEYMATKGIMRKKVDQEQMDELDMDMEECSARRAQPKAAGGTDQVEAAPTRRQLGYNAPTVSHTDLDDDLENYMNNKGTTDEAASAAGGGDVTKPFRSMFKSKSSKLSELSRKKLVDRSMNLSGGDVQDLDDELEAYMQSSKTVYGTKDTNGFANSSVQSSSALDQTDELGDDPMDLGY
jgi:hypothetical protein